MWLPISTPGSAPALSQFGRGTPVLMPHSPLRLNTRAEVTYLVSSATLNFNSVAAIV